MSDVEFRSEKIDMPDAGAVVYRLHGVLGDSQHCYDFLDDFLDCLETCPDKIVFNLAELENMYSAGIGILANCFTKARSSDKTLSICCVKPVIHRTLTITGVEPMLKEYASEEEALAAS
ncbi:MAG: STAS domain-containing protein [Planctomycetota bacterium]|nr:STAS domain-containing protein [Planctomycetota bacterium]